VNGHLFHVAVTFAVSYDFGMTSLVKASLTFWVESYQSDFCQVRAMTLSHLHLVVNWPDFAIYICCFITKI